MNKKILQLAIPSIVSNITVPLLGLIDVAIVGHLGSAAYIGAIAVGGMLFNIIYWLFGFLRMGTSGMTSQAFGQRDLKEVTRVLLRAVGVGLFIALCLLLLQYPIRKIAFLLIDATPEVRELATVYFNICVWGAPAVLGLYSFAGWFIGMQNSRFPMFIAITQNVVNIVASLSFVYLLDMKIEGVALGTLIPTSMTVVDTSTSIDLAANSSIIRFLSAGRIFPWPPPDSASSGYTGKLLHRSDASGF